MENYDSEIETLKKEIETLQIEDKKKSEIQLLKKKLEVLNFRRKHNKLLSITNKLEKGTIGVFKGLGKAINKAGQALEKSDNYIAKEKLKEAELNNKLKKSKVIKLKKKTIFQEAGDID
jgi:hypothetical protein